MKYLLQILSSLVYTLIVSSIFYFIVVIPLMFIITLKWWAIILLLMVLGGLLEWIKYLISTFALMPYVWICKRNVVATGMATVLMLATFIRYGYILFTFEEGSGFWYYAACVFASFEFLSLFYASLLIFIQCYTEEISK